MTNTAENNDLMTETLFFEDMRILQSLCGEHDRHLKSIAKRLDVKVRVRGNEIELYGKEPGLAPAKQLLRELYFIIESGYPLNHVDMVHAIKMIAENPGIQLKDIFLDTVVLTHNKKPITPKSFTQKKYVDAIRNYDIVFGIGPAGTGKTYLAMAMGVAALLQKKVDRIILTRPAVEAGEKLGYLPGDLLEKVNPYLRPLYDALHDLMDLKHVTEMLHQGIIEVAPLAFMRGRTLNDSFVILDEGQNTTSEQMKMFLTRLGFNSQAVITGDITQVDLPPGRVSGLTETRDVLAGVPGIQVVTFSEKDVVRHPLVEEIIKAYETAAQDDIRRGD